jgi:hypothetical protein
LLALFLVDPGRCQTGPAASPILQLNVRALGYAPEPWPIENYGRIGIDPVCFLSNDAVAITFVTREAPGALSRRGQSDELLPYRLHAFFIDPKTGRVINTRDWPSSSLRSRVLPATGQKFVVLTPDRLLLYSSEFNLLGQLDVTWGRESIKDHWEVAHSPGGKYLLINYEPQADAKRIDQLPPTTPLSDWEPVERFERIDLENLQEVERWTTKICHDCFFTLGDHDAFGISDDGMVQRWKNVPGGTPFNSKIVEIGKPPDGPWRELCPYYQPYCRPGGFVSSETFIAEREGKPGEFWLVSTNGGLLLHEVLHENETIFAGHLPSHASWNPSADGRRFAVAVMKIKGANAFLDIGGHSHLDRVMVFDIPSRQWIYTLNAPKRKIADISGMALSPDGLYLALITQGGILEIYRLP